VASTPLPRKRNPDFPTRENLSDQKLRAFAVLAKLHELYPTSTTALDWRNPFELLVATILSAQCTDVRVNKVTPALFRRFPDPASYADSSQEEVEQLVRTTGFFRNKAKNIRGAAARIVSEHDGQVPKTMEELLKLPGVARKTANCVLGAGFGQAVGVVVDTHVGRIARRMGYSRQSDPVKVELDLIKKFPTEEWVYLSHSWIDHGRAVCTARTAHCQRCKLAALCPQKV
jgi:endonuclease III